MHTGGPGSDGRDPPDGDAPKPGAPPPLPEKSLGGGRPPYRPPPGTQPPPAASGDPASWSNRRDRSTGEKIGIALLIVVVGIPVGLFIFGALLFGACLLGAR